MKKIFFKHMKRWPSFTHNNGNTIILTINLNYPESKGKGSSISKEIFKKRTKVGELTLSDIKSHYKTTVI